jgi:hypothetical protein
VFTGANIEYVTKPATMDDMSSAAFERAKAIAKFMDENSADEILEESVDVGAGEAVAVELRKLGFVVKVEPRYKDQAFTVVAREVLNISRP